jgi:hypothetical protein
MTAHYFLQGLNVKTLKNKTTTNKTTESFFIWFQASSSANAEEAQ